MAVINQGAMFPSELESEIFNRVKGHSSLAKLSGQEALPFVGKDIFTFNFSGDISIVGESEAKPAGDGAIEPITMAPIKVVYQMRTSDEFMTASDEYQLNILSAFADGFSRKLASGLDKMAMHGINPATGSKASQISDKAFDAKIKDNKVAYKQDEADVTIDAAVAAVEGAEYAATGIAMSTAMRSDIAALTANGARKYPEFAFGGMPESMGSMSLDVNATVDAGTGDRAIVGDFENCFKWGIAKEIPLETIEFGDPDGQGDLKKFNQVLLRSEAFIGWAIMDPSAFAIVTSNSDSQL